MLPRLFGWKGNLRSRNNVRRNGTEERPEWGASPAKPSKPLRTETKRTVLPLGVRTEFLAGCTSGFAVDLSALVACSRAYLSVRLREQRENVRGSRALRPARFAQKEERLCRRFHNSYEWAVRKSSARRSRPR